MAAAMRHRGPDDEGFLAGDPRAVGLALGIRRLSIIDLAGGHQPIGNADGSMWIVCNGEVYNFRELRAELEACGNRFKTGSDSEVILHAYAQYGDDFLSRLNGMYAFALWDGRRRRLLVGRDRLGIKPLYYVSDGRRFAFASEAKSLLELPGMGRRVHQAALNAYLELGYVPAPLSMFDGVRKIPVATVMEVKGRDVGGRSYWSMPRSVDTGPSEDEWAERVRARLEESVRMQMVSDVPIGAFLSGGIDSSAVLAFMARHSSSPVRTYSIGFEGSAADQFYNELPYAKQMAQRFNTEHHEIVVRPDVIGLLPRLLWHMDEPIADTAFVTTYLVAQFARRDVTVILSGVGGDELFGGYRRYLGDHYLRRLRLLPRPLRRAAARAAQLLPSDRHSTVLNFLRYASAFLASAELSFEERYRAYVGVFSPPDALMLSAGGAGNRVDALSEAFAHAPQQDPLNRMFAVDALTQLPDDLLMLTDKMTMATSLECRVPFLDHELVEMAARMPGGVKVAGGTLKHLLKRSLSGVLPEDVLQRKKRGFGAPMGAWLKNELAGLLGHLLSASSVGARGFFNHARIEELAAAHRANRVDGTDRLLALLNFEIWCRVFLDRRSPADVALELKEAAG